MSIETFVDARTIHRDGVKPRDVCAWTISDLVLTALQTFPIEAVREALQESRVLSINA